MPLYDYRCNDGHRFESLRPAGTQATTCKCGQLAIRVYGYKAAEIREPEPDMRGMYRRFTEAREELSHQGYRGPDLWQASKERAKQFSRAGENPVVRS